MVIRNLYLSIYLTVVAVLLVFALVAGLLVHRHADAERGRIELAVSERTEALAKLLENSLPEAGAPEDQQRAALTRWASRLQLALALDAADGHRIASSELFVLLTGEADRVMFKPVRVSLSDGRALWVHRPRHPHQRNGWLGNAGDEPQPGEATPPGLTWPAHGPERGPRQFELWLGDGPIELIEHLAGGPRPRWMDEGGILLRLLAVLFVAIAAGSYPVVRRLTRRLEALQQGVDAFGAGHLSHRVATDGRDEVAALASSFNQAAQRIEDLVRSHRSLLANASHELRSPLARLKMAVSMTDAATPMQRLALKAEIDRDIRELDALVDEVLLASRLDTQAAIASDPIDLLALCVEEAVHVGATLDMPDQDGLAGVVLPWQLRGDERLLRRALRNLLENALRYGGEAIELQLQAVDGALLMAVCDRGPGVPESERERIFEPFYRLPGHAEHAGGVGLGLSLVRQIAQRHGGQVRCEPREGGGSRFVLSLPRR
ncbi:MAG: ATP-binding protein [Leptothrix sp. (in: b-proteobacteria)]